MLIVLIATLCLQWIVCNGCRCAMTHPQHYFCNSEFVLRVNVTGSAINVDDEMTRDYDIDVVSIFKGEGFGGRSNVSTHVHSATCGVYLEIDQQYVLTGSRRADGIAWIHSCSFQRKWDLLTEDQRSGFSEDYGRSCGCEICMEQSRSQNCAASSCVYPLHSSWKMADCYNKHSVFPVASMPKADVELLPLVRNASNQRIENDIVHTASYQMIGAGTANFDLLTLRTNFTPGIGLFNNGTNISGIGSMENVPYYPAIKLPLHVVVLYGIAYAVIFLLGIIGNLLVITVVYNNIRMHNVTNYLIVNLSVADLLVSIFVLPITLLSNIFYGEYVK
ncbi:unnamed protein product [Owenia fusiformis]|uniref:G-protein coupled receptors family 1 profile domain-containing protein n=1 Tax=Owenia fusiformis TaxID=6347 RepID=A0A8S4PPC3_OWEFU|nr:unnamed protein product [Owenia fusiformis]